MLGYGDSIYFVDVVDGDVSQWVPKDAPPGDYFFQYDLTPDVNPITAEIVFATLRHRIEKTLDFEIIAAGLDGSDYRRLTKSAGSDLAPAWSPDGTRIAFVSERRAYASKEDDLNPGTYHLHIMDADGSNVRVVAPSVSVTPQRPIWSPDGAHLAFRFGHTLYTATVDGSELNVLGKTEIEPAWSPDGQWIAFSQIEPDGEQMRDQELLIARPNGSDVLSVIRFSAGKLISVYLGNLSWSADGLALRFSVLIGGPSGEYGIYRIGTDGSDLELMVGFNAKRMILAWSPDGERIAVIHHQPSPTYLPKTGCCIRSRRTDRRSVY